MKEIFLKIINSSVHMHGLREDNGHEEAVIGFAEILCKKYNANEDIIIPAVILHDIGYFGMDSTILKLMMQNKLSKLKKEQIKKEHMEKGAILAESILKRLNYNNLLIPIITNIIKRHDLDNKPRNIEEKIVRDADKLWRYSDCGFFLDVKRRNCKIDEWHNKLSGNLDNPLYFYLEESKRIAREELEKKKNNSSSPKI